MFGSDFRFMPLVSCFFAIFLFLSGTVFSFLDVRIFSVSPAYSADRGEASKRYVSDLMSDIISIVNSRRSNASKEKSFRALLDVTLDSKRAAFFTLGRYARSLARADRERFYTLFNAHLTTIFSRHMDRLLGARFQVISVQIRSSKDVIVSGRLSFSDGRSPLSVKWRLYTGGGKIQIFDINIDGLWIALQQRSDFTSYIKNNGGDVGALLSRLSSLYPQ